MTIKGIHSTSFECTGVVQETRPQPRSQTGRGLDTWELVRRQDGEGHIYLLEVVFNFLLGKPENGNLLKGELLTISNYRFLMYIKR